MAADVVASVRLLMTDERKDLVTLMKTCEAAEMYDEMTRFAEVFLRTYIQDLTAEERNLFSVAFKNRMGALRASWRILTSESQGDPKIVRLREHLEIQMEAISGNVIQLANNYLQLAEAKSPENLVFFLKMVGDYNRYMAEIKQPNDTYARAAADAYRRGQETSQLSLATTDPVRLGLALNYSTYFYDIAKNPVLACATARKTFDDAVSQLDSLPEATYKDATLILQLLRDNITLWSSDDNDAATGGG